MLVTLASFVLLVMVIILVHECGHYFVARYFGVQVDVFSIGIGPKLYTRRSKSGTEFRICPILIAGYIRMHGEMLPTDEQAQLINDEKSFASKSLGARSLIVAAGPLANFLFAFSI